MISFRFELQGRLTNRDSGQRRQIEDRLHQMSSMIEGVCGDVRMPSGALWPVILPACTPILGRT